MLTRFFSTRYLPLFCAANRASERSPASAPKSCVMGAGRPDASTSGLKTPVCLLTRDGAIPGPLRTCVGSCVLFFSYIVCTVFGSSVAATSGEIPIEIASAIACFFVASACCFVAAACCSAPDKCVFTHPPNVSASFAAFASYPFGPTSPYRLSGSPGGEYAAVIPGVYGLYPFASAFIAKSARDCFAACVWIPCVNNCCASLSLWSCSSRACCAA